MTTMSRARTDILCDACYEEVERALVMRVYDGSGRYQGNLCYECRRAGKKPAPRRSLRGRPPAITSTREEEVPVTTRKVTKKPDEPAKKPVEKPMAGVNPIRAAILALENERMKIGDAIAALERLEARR